MDKYFQSWVWNPDHETNSFWRSWLTANPQKAAEVEEARHTLQNLVFPAYRLPEKEVTGMWKRIRGREPLPLREKENGFPSRWMWSAAAILVIGLLVYFLFLNRNMVTYETAFGETRNIILPDQSIVVLNANSKLCFENKWDKSSARELTLEGEAYFSVTHNHKQPFRVMTDDGVSVEVLGTTFNVYHRTRETKVVLNTGKISLSLPTADAGQKIIMQPGELVEFKSNRYHKKKVNPERYLAWTQNKLVLDHTSLNEMVKMLQDNYGVEVDVVPSTLLDQTVSGSMPAGNEQDLIDQIGKAFRLQITREGNKIIMRE